MKLLLILASALTLTATGSTSYRTESFQRPNHEPDRDRRTNLDYDGIETADQNQVDRFEPSEKQDSHKSIKIGTFSAVQSIQVAKKAQRRLPSTKDSEASGTHFEGAPYGHHYTPQVQQFQTHELLNQGLVPLYHHQTGGGPSPNNLVLTGLGDEGSHGQFIVAGGGPGAPGHFTVPENDLSADVTRSVYVLSAPPDPFGFGPKLPQRPQKPYQVVFIKAPTPPPPHHHPAEIPPPPGLKTLVYLLVKPQHPPPINFIKNPPPPHLNRKPEVYFVRYKNRGYGLSPSPVGPLEENIHPGQFTPVHPQEEIRGNVDYGPAIAPQYETASHHQPYELEGYQDDAHIAATQVLTQRGSNSNRKVDGAASI